MFKELKMLSSTSYVDKVQKKNSGPLKISQVKINSSLTKADGSNTALKSEASLQRSNEVVDLKEFPALKVAGGFSGNSCFESKGPVMQYSKVQLSSINNIKTKRRESFPALTEFRKFKKNNGDSEDKLAESGVVKNVAGFVPKKVEVNLEKINQTEHIDMHNQGILTKKTTTQSQKNTKKRKRADPICINLEDIIVKNKSRERRKQQNIFKKRQHRLNDKELLSGNLLDASNPKRSRGKHREIKKKKLTNFKKSIIKERLLKQKMREVAVSACYGCGNVNLIDEIDFSSEIKIYLNKLSERKAQNLEKSKNKLSDKINDGCAKNKSHEKNRDNFKGCAPVLKEKKIPQVTAEGEIKFSSKFREYCDNIITHDLNCAISELIKGLINLQDKLFLRDPIKARARKKHVSGIREVKKQLGLKKVKMIIIAPNLEKLQMEGGVYDSINEVKSIANSQNVPYGFALDRYMLGRCTKKNVPVSAFAVLSHEGIETLFENALHQLTEAKKKFAELAKPKEVDESKESVNSQVISSLISAFREELKLSSEATCEPD